MLIVIWGGDYCLCFVNLIFVNIVFVTLLFFLTIILLINNVI